MDIQPIFVMGSARSGTTLLASMIANSPRVASYKAETLLMYGCDKAYGPLDNAAAKKRFAADWVNSRQYRRLGLPEGSALDHLSQASSYEELVKLLLDDIARNQQKQSWLDSTPSNVYVLPLIAKQFPNAKVIHIVRDGRAVAASLRKLGWTSIAGTSQFGALQYSALKWAGAVQSFQQNSHVISGGVLEVTYEALVTDAESVLDEIWRYLEFSKDEIPLSIADEESIASETSTVASNSAFGSLGSGVSKEPLRRWRKQLTAIEIAGIEDVAGDVLVRNGYELLSGYELAGYARVVSRMRSTIFSAKMFAKRVMPFRWMFSTPLELRSD